MSDQEKNKTIKILMVDDDLMLLKLYEMTAQAHEEIKFFTAANTIDADKITREETPDVILLDLILGKEPDTPITETDKSNGFNFLLALKNDPATGDIPVIILSNLDTRQDHERAIKLHAFDYIVKAKTTPKQVLQAAKGAVDITGAEKKIREAKNKLGE